MANYKFSANKMIKRCKSEGKSSMLTVDTVKFIKSLDGKVGSDYNWRSTVNGEDLVYISDAKTYVARVDCDPV